MSSEINRKQKHHTNRQRADISKLVPYLRSIGLYPTDAARWPPRIIREQVKVPIVVLTISNGTQISNYEVKQTHVTLK